jgi:hypothetical protein
MDADRVFVDAALKPTEAALSEALGGTRQFYDRVLALAEGHAATWGFAKGSGWMLKVADKKKALFYVTPLRGRFNVGLTLRESEREELLKREDLAPLHDAMREARQFSEGYALYFSVDGAEGCAQVEALVPNIVAMRH